MANWQYPLTSTRLGSQLFLFPRQALRGTRGADLESVIVQNFFGPYPTGVVVTAQAAQSMAAGGTVTESGRTGTVDITQAAQAVAAIGDNGAVAPPIVVVPPSRPRRSVVVLPPERSKFKPLPVRVRISTEQDEQALSAVGAVKEKITGIAQNSHQIISVVRAKGHKNTFHKDMKILRMIWDIEEAA